MTTTMDAGGTITIPQEVVEEAGLKPGTPLEITVRDGHIEIEPATMGMRLEKRGRLTVLVPIDPVAETLTIEQVNEIIDELRDEKMTEILGQILQDRIDRRD